MVPLAHGVAAVLRGNASALLVVVKTGTIKHGIHFSSVGSELCSYASSTAAIPWS